MDEGTDPSAQEDSAKKDSQAAPRTNGPSKKQIRIVLGIALILLVVGGGSFWVGSRRQETQIAKESINTEGAEPEMTEDVSPTPELRPTTDLSPTPFPSPTPTPAKTPTPTPTPTPQSEITTFYSSSTIDGFRSSNGGGNAGLEVRAGRNVNLVTRGFVSFGTASLPAAATIEKATLKLYQVLIIGDPYGVGARVMIDHLDYGDSLENADYSAGSISSSFATLSTNSTLEWKEVDVTDAVRSDRANNRERTQFRLHMAIESQGGTVEGDFSYFESADNNKGSGNTPQLVVTYR